jgi:hypothetical protein
MLLILLILILLFGFGGYSFGNRWNAGYGPGVGLGHRPGDLPGDLATPWLRRLPRRTMVAR